ncbi:MAG: class I SAM-dependent methyltransferase [Candidatus Parvarchaeota archaeon]|jgi:ubiquinone/menaquinone biosynthesis C-methylase UbiE|nr:class I SAM-dependent methyltransferase [Candidatus Parvarchaeota archaeon]MCL5420800.1 class I SAM-dependent methyltransferase [Candidatus Parvarchaeota archaeon]
MVDRITISTYNKIADFYKSRHNTGNFWKKEYGEFERNLQGKTILDAGCGFGRDSKHFVEQGLSVVGIDASIGMLRLARKNVPEAKFICMDMLKPAFKSDSFDGVWCCASLLHVRRKQARTVLNAFRKILKQRGILFVSVKEGRGERYKTYPDRTKRFFSYYSKKSLKKLVESADFKIVSLRRRDDELDDAWLTVLARK